MKNLLILKSIPTLLNRLYIPIVRSGKPSIIKSKDGKESTKLIQMECIRQKANKMLSGGLSMKIDFCIARGKKEPDIDSFLKLLLDSIEGLCYTNDKQIKCIQIRKHVLQEESELIIEIKEIE